MAEPKEPTALDKARSDQQPAAAVPAKVGVVSNDIGTALRNAFRATVEEDVPTEMLDLLRRLD